MEQQKEKEAWRCLKLDPDPRITLLFGVLSADGKTLLLDRFTTLGRSEHEYWYALLSTNGAFGFITRVSLHALATKQEQDNQARRLAQDESSSSSSSSSSPSSSSSSSSTYSQRMLKDNCARIGKKMPETAADTTKAKTNSKTAKTATTTTFNLFQKFQQDALNWSSILVTQRDLSFKAPMVLPRPLFFSSSPTPTLIDTAMLVAYEMNGLSGEMTMLPNLSTVRIQDAPGAEDARGMLIRKMVGGKFDLCSCRLYANQEFTCYTFICDYPSFLAAVVTVHGIRILRERKIQTFDKIRNDFWTFFCSAYIDQFRALREKRVVFSSTGLCSACRDHWRVHISSSSSPHFAVMLCDPTNH